MKKILVALFILVFASFAWAGPFPQFEEKSWADMCMTVVRVYTFGHGTGIYPDDDGKLTYGIGAFAMEAHGVVVAPGIVVTAAHVVEPERVSIQTHAYAYWNVSIVDIRDRVISLGDDGTVPAYIVKIDKEKDLVVLRYSSHAKFEPVLTSPSSTYEQIPFLGFVDLLEITEARIAVIANIRDENGEADWKSEVRYGDVLSAGPQLPIGSEYLLPAFSMNEFTMNIPVYPGDSGSPVFLVVGDKAYLIGIVTKICLICPGIVSYATRLDSVLNILLEARAQHGMV